MSAAPGLAGILETCVYHASGEREAMERFYLETLGLERVAGWPGAFACRLPTGILLVFERETLAARRGPVTAHGSQGPGHVCLLAAEGAYAEWQERLGDAGTEITHEEQWGERGRSFYFHDPAGNLLEIADRDIWPPR
jgi:catechol 2,3-dioxygenase-like lactoylglutathione lyase family enzyme